MQVFTPGMDLILTRWIALSGTVKAAFCKDTELRKHFPSPMIEQALRFGLFLDTRRDGRAAREAGAAVVYPLGVGGILSGFWAAAEESGVGLNVDLRRIPIRQETVEICEYLDLNPYYLHSGGALLLGAKDGFRLEEELNRAGIPASCVGRTTAGKDRILYNQGRVRYLDRPKRDEIYKLGDQENERTDFNISGEKQPDRLKGAGCDFGHG